jgi:hypothetical protein
VTFGTGIVIDDDGYAVYSLPDHPHKRIGATLAQVAILTCKAKIVWPVRPSTDKRDKMIYVPFVVQIGLTIKAVVFLT